MNIPWKTVIWAAVAVAAVAAIVLVFLPEPVPVDVAEVKHGSMQVVLEAEGRTRVFDRYVVSAPVSGTLGRVSVEIGDVLQRGSVVATIAPLSVDNVQRAQIEGRIASAEANVQRLRRMAAGTAVRLAEVERERDRMREVVAAGAVARRELDRAASAVEMVRTEMAAAESAVTAAEAEAATLRSGRAAYHSGGDRSAVTLRSPAVGRVLRLYEHDRRAVAAGTPILEIGDPNGLEIVIDVLSSDAVAIRPGAPVVISGWGGERTLNARVRYVEPAAFSRISALGIDEQRVNVIAEFVSPPSALGDNYRVEASIVIWDGDDVCMVPTGALFRHGEQWAVFRLEEGRAARRTVRLGRRNPHHAEVLDGLAAGDRVVVHPSDQVVDDVDVVERTARK